MYSGGALAASLLRGTGGSTAEGAADFVSATTDGGTTLPDPINSAYPSGLAANDIAIVYIRAYDGGAASGVTIATPSGWNLIEQNNMGSTSWTHAAFWKRLAGSETGSQAFVPSATSASGGANWAVTMLVYRGALTSGTPIEQIVTERLAAAISMTGGPLRYIAGADRTIVHCHGLRSNGSETVAAGDGFNLRASQTGGGRRIAVTDRQTTTPVWLNEESALSAITDSTGAALIGFSIIPETAVSSTTPVLIDPYIDDTVFLSSMEGIDGTLALLDGVSPGHTITRAGSSGTGEIDTAQFKFGAASLRRTTGRVMTGLSDSTNRARWQFGADPFTLECWARFNTAPSSGFHYLFAQYDTGAGQRSWALVVESGNLKLLLSSAGSSGTTKADAAWSPSTATWYHVAADWDGTNYRTYVDGTMMGKAATGITLHTSTAPLTVGAALNSGASNGAFDGWIDEVRITKGTARYASDSGYTVPSAAFPRG